MCLLSFSNLPRKISQLFKADLFLGGDEEGGDHIRLPGGGSAASSEEQPGLPLSPSRYHCNKSLAHPR